MLSVTTKNVMELLESINAIESKENKSNLAATRTRNNATRQLLKVINDNDLIIKNVRSCGKYPLNTGDLLEAVTKALIAKKGIAKTSFNNCNDIYICGKRLELKAHFHNKYTATATNNKNDGLCFIWTDGSFHVFTTTRDELQFNSEYNGSKGGKLNLNDCMEEDIYTTSKHHDEFYNAINYIAKMINA